MWRDPLDELIAGLDRVVTPDPSAAFPSMADVITVTDTILYGSAAAKARLPHTPAYQRFTRWSAASNGRAPQSATPAGTDRRTATESDEGA
jgi:hypothetical protein